MRLRRQFIKFLPHNLIRHRLYSSVGKGSFPLALPKDFEFTGHSVIYSNGHRTIPEASTATLPVINPATEDVLQHINAAPTESMTSAVYDAHRVFTSGAWSRAEPTERFHVLTRMASLLRENAKELAALETLQTGRPIREMTAQLSRIPEWFEYHASLARTCQSHVLPFKGNVLNYTTTRPIGVVALITPWNHPLLITIKKLAPALAAGNSVIIKPSEKAPLSVQHLISTILPQSGLPLGTVHVLLGAGDIARALVQNQHISRIDFTGGTATGRKLASLAGERLVPITAELGGKTAVLVCEDADIDSAVEGILTAGFIASGQTCVTGSRVIIQDGVYEEVVEKLVQRARLLRVGRPWEEETDIGTVIDDAAVRRCEWFVETARSEGANVLLGGESTRVDGRGYFFKPTLLGDCLPSHTSVRNEIFGPVISLLRAKTRQDMLHTANDSPYTLAASIWTKALSHAHTMARGLNAGIIWVNAHHLNDPSSPWGGWGESGLGRENGRIAFRESLRESSVVVNLDERPLGWFAGGESARYG